MFTLRKLTASVTIMVALVMGMSTGIAYAALPSDDVPMLQEGERIVFEDEDSIIVALDEIPAEFQCAESVSSHNEVFSYSSKSYW